MSVVRDTNKLTVVTGQSDVIELLPRKYRVFVNFVGAASGTLTFKQGVDEDNLLTIPTDDGSGSEATVTADKVFTIDGGGVFGVSGATISGTITVTVIELLT